MSYVIDHGAEVRFADDHKPNPVRADRIELLEGGFVKLIIKSSYSVEIYPSAKIAGIYTHTEDEENADWW